MVIILIVFALIGALLITDMMPLIGHLNSNVAGFSTPYFDGGMRVILLVSYSGFWGIP